MKAYEITLLVIEDDAMPSAEDLDWDVLGIANEIRVMSCDEVPVPADARPLIGSTSTGGPLGIVTDGNVIRPRRLLR